MLGEVLRHFGIHKALMFGHSDGGAMSVLAAAAHPELVCGVLACSPTMAIDPFMVDAMAGARRAFEQDGLREKLQRHHGDSTDAMFWAGTSLGQPAGAAMGHERRGCRSALPGFRVVRQ